MEFQAQEALRAGDQAGGKQILESLLKEFPRQDQARAQLSQMLLSAGEADRATTVLKDGLQLDPRNETFLNQLAYMEAASGNLSAAVQADDQYMAIRPNDPNPWDTRGDILFMSDRADEAVEAYRKVLALKPDFIGSQDLAKMAIVYADQKKFDLADSALQEYGKRATGTAKFYVSVFAGQFQETRGDLEGARASYQQAVQDLAGAGQNDGADGALVSMASISFLTGGGLASDLAFARRQKLSGREYNVIALLQAAQGDTAGFESSVRLYAAARPELGQQGMEQFRNYSALYVALVRKDPQGVTAAAGRLPNSVNAVFRFPRGSGLFAGQGLQPGRAGSSRGDSGRESVVKFQLHAHPLTADGSAGALLSGQVYEATGKREQAANEYQEFLSHFGSSRANLPRSPWRAPPFTARFSDDLLTSR